MIGTFTKLGSYYDKVSDMITWALTVMVIGWQAYRMSGDAKLIVFAAASVIALNLRGYMKWLTVAETERVRWLEARQDPSGTVAKHTAPIVIKPPPERTARDWAIWFLKKVAVVFIFEEMDLWFWIGLAMLIDRLDWLLWLMMISQCAGVAAQQSQHQVGEIGAVAGAEGGDHRDAQCPRRLELAWAAADWLERQSGGILTPGRRKLPAI